jgi:large subunit ribosomal protein L15
MNLNELPKVNTRPAKRLGRGLGSGKGKTSGRGQKGQKARGKIPAANVGAGLILYKKLPYRRGWSRHGGNPPKSPKPVIIKTSELNTLPKSTVVNVENLVNTGIISEKAVKKTGVKVLADEELKVALNLEIPVSGKVREMVEKAGGSVK